MSNVQKIQSWYHNQHTNRLAKVVLATMRADRVRQAVIKRMSQTYAYHITSTGKWNAMRKLTQMKQEEQWTTRYATMLQAVVRAMMAKKFANKMRHHRARKEAREQRSSIVIQKIWRGYLNRTEIVKRAYYVVQEAARRRWVVRSSDNVHRNEILEVETEKRERLRQEQNARKLRQNVMRYTIQETPEGRKRREKERKSLLPESVKEWYEGPQFSKNELFEDMDVKEEEEDGVSLSSESDDDESATDSPRYW